MGNDKAVSPARKKIDIVGKPQVERFELLVTLGYILGCLSKSEVDWLRGILASNWYMRPNPNTATTNYGA